MNATLEAYEKMTDYKKLTKCCNAPFLMDSHFCDECGEKAKPIGMTDYDKALRWYGLGITTYEDCHEDTIVDEFKLRCGSYFDEQGALIKELI